MTDTKFRLKLKPELRKAFDKVSHHSFLNYDEKSNSYFFDGIDFKGGKSEFSLKEYIKLETSIKNICNVEAIEPNNENKRYMLKMKTNYKKLFFPKSTKDIYLGYSRKNGDYAFSPEKMDNYIVSKILFTSEEVNDIPKSLLDLCEGLTIG